MDNIKLTEAINALHALAQPAYRNIDCKEN